MKGAPRLFALIAATMLGTGAEKKSRDLLLAVMDMWKPFRNVTNTHAPQAAILFDKFGCRGLLLSEPGIRAGRVHRQLFMGFPYYRIAVTS
jgi:hypothetical protein